jgi:hypothetical protein
MAAAISQTERIREKVATTRRSLQSACERGIVAFSAYFSSRSGLVVELCLHRSDKSYQPDFRVSDDTKLTSRV